MANLKTNEISFNVLDFLEKKRISSDHFRALWQSCEWENKLKIKQADGNLDDLLVLLKDKFKLHVVEELSINTEKFNTLCMYTRFVLGKDLLINLSVEEHDGKTTFHVRLRSQNMGVVILVGKQLKRLSL